MRFLLYRRVLKKAYKLDYRTTFQGLPVSIENRKGSIRRGDGWQTKMFYPYGYITCGTSKDTPDGDCLDVYIGPYALSRWSKSRMDRSPPHDREHHGLD